MRGSSSNMIPSENYRHPLSFGEREALKEQHRIRALADGKRPEDDEAARMRRITVDPGGVKQTTFATLDNMPSADKFPR
jgi:hypothetical protein